MDIATEDDLRLATVARLAIQMLREGNTAGALSVLNREIQFEETGK